MTLTRNLADSLAPHQVRVNQINLGWVLTPNEKKLMTDSGHPPDWWKNPPTPTPPPQANSSPQKPSPPQASTG